MSGFSRVGPQHRRTRSESLKADIPDQQRRRTSASSLSGINNNNNNGPNAADKPFPFVLKMASAPDDIRKKVRRRLSDRRAYRITDTAHMLQNRGVLSRKEADWLLKFGKSNEAMHKMLGDLLKVPRFTWKDNQHGIRNREDRNKIRMQTLRAFISEAMKTAESDTNADESRATFRQAYRVAANTRRSLTETVLGQKLETYKLITTQTLQNPAQLHEAYKRAFHIVVLQKRTLPILREGYFGNLISDAYDVAEAAQDLVDYDLLDESAALRLRHALGSAQHIQAVNQLMDLTSNETLEPADRRKIRSLLLLALAYGYLSYALDTKTWVQRPIGRNEIPGMTDAISNAVARNLNAEPEDMANLRQPAHKWLLDLRRYYSDTGEISGMWLACAKLFADRDRNARVRQNQPGTDITLDELNAFNGIMNDTKEEEQFKKGKQENDNLREKPLDDFGNNKDNDDGSLLSVSASGDDDDSEAIYKMSDDKIINDIKTEIGNVDSKDNKK